MASVRISGWVRFLRAWGLTWAAVCATVAGVLLVGPFGSDATPGQGGMWHMTPEARWLTSVALGIFAAGTAIPALCTLWRGTVRYVLALVVLAMALLVGASLMEASRLTLADMGSAVLVVELAVFVARPVRQFIIDGA